MLPEIRQYNEQQSVQGKQHLKKLDLQKKASSAKPMQVRKIPSKQKIKTFDNDVGDLGISAAKSEMLERMKNVRKEAQEASKPSDSDKDKSKIQITKVKSIKLHPTVVDCTNLDSEKDMTSKNIVPKKKSPAVNPRIQKMQGKLKAVDNNAQIQVTKERSVKLNPTVVDSTDLDSEEMTTKSIVPKKNSPAVDLRIQKMQEKLKADVNNAQGSSANKVNNRLSKHSESTDNQYCSRKQSTVGKVANTKPSHELNFFRDFIYFILVWNPKWLEEQEKYPIPPPLCKDPIFPLLDQYTSIDEYYKIMKPLMLHELWQQTFRDWCKNTKAHNCAKASVAIVGVFPWDFVNSCGSEQAARPSNDVPFIDLHCQGLVLRNSKFRFAGYDLVSLSLLTNGKMSHKFGYVETVIYSRVQNAECLSPILANSTLYKKPDTLLMKAVIRIRNRPHIVFDPKSLCDVETVTSLITSHRQFSALHGLPKSLLVRDILLPVNMHVFTSPQTLELDHSVKTKYNLSQQEAIQKITSAALEGYGLPRICMLQGPPGTGKSYTIVGCVGQIFSQAKKVNQKSVKILLCAPSNAAVDELLKKLIDYKHRQPPNERLKLLRVGNPNSLHPNVTSYSLERLTAQELEKQINNKNSMESISLQKNILVTKINTLINKLEDTKGREKRDNIKHDIRVLEKRTDQLDNQLKKSGKMQFTDKELKKMEAQIKSDLLLKADVVCSTLNYSGSRVLMDVLAQRGMMHFTCILVDEASQTTEVDSLVPLQYACSKLILVGDPEQLPATVLSKEASNMNFGKSLFERLYNHFKHNDNNPVMLLDIQYRMHKDIASFPSKHVYGSRLKTDESVDKRHKYGKYPFRPYILFNLEDSKETQQNPGFIYNYVEADFITSLCGVLQAEVKTNNRDISIGIVTPYQKQKAEITYRINKKNLKNIEVNTVDGFQGREKDIIILSCVRAKHDHGNIGFLANKQRMNVALTRARFSLFVVGHLPSLEVNEDWKELIEDGRERQVILDLRSAINSRQLLSYVLLTSSKH